MIKWMLAGAALGSTVVAVAFAPAAWLADALGTATDGRVLLADARGSLWQGSAVMVLTGGAGSRDASALPGRIYWQLGLDGTALALRARHACCIHGQLALRVVPGVGRWRIELPASTGAIGQWPASWLVGLGTPWNTLHPLGSLQVSSPGLVMEAVQGRWRFSGQAQLDVGSFASRLSTLPVLGSYRLTLKGAPGSESAGGTAAAGADAATVQLTTTSGALQLGGSGQWAAGRLRFRGQASAEPGSEPALNNLLNIIGRRQGALSLISIG